MPELTDRIADIVGRLDAVVFDQWGVLHNGSTAYAGAADALHTLHRQGKKLAVLSNSGKRADANRDRIAAMGLPAELFDVVMTSGEAFWQDCQSGRVVMGRVFPITAKPGDFETWRGPLPIREAGDVLEANSVLLMGLPEGSDGSTEASVLKTARSCGLPLYCTNPDRGSPRAGGAIQLSPGALAHAYQDAGGEVTFYGKPHLPVFDALTDALGTDPAKILMVGDSLEHDIAGGASAGWQTAFVMGGLHADAFVDADAQAALERLAAAHASPLPDYMISHLASPGA